jgi:hypothetical protein
MAAAKTKMVLGWLVLLALAPRPVRAQPTRDPAGAEQLFNSAKELLKAGDWKGACAKFEASLALDPSISTELKIAKCHEHEGKLARAWSDYQEAIKHNRELSDRPEKRRLELEEFAKAQLAELEPRVPKVRVIVHEPPPGLRIKRGALELPLAALGDALPADAGTLHITAEAPGFATLERDVTVVEGKTIDVEITLSREVAPPPAPPPPPAAAPLATVASPTPPLPSNQQRTAGIASMAVGGVTLASAGALAIVTRVLVAQSSGLCNAQNVCNKEGFELRNQAASAQSVSLVLAGVGAVSGVVGAVLFARAPRASPARIRGGITTMGGFVAGDF